MTVFILLIVLTFLFYIGVLQFFLKTFRDLVFGSLLFVILVFVFMIWLNTLPMGILKNYELFLPSYFFIKEDLPQSVVDTETLPIPTNLNKEFMVASLQSLYKQSQSIDTIKTDLKVLGQLPNQKDLHTLVASLNKSYTHEAFKLNKMFSQRLDLLNSKLDLMIIQDGKLKSLVSQHHSLVKEYTILQKEYFDLQILLKEGRDTSRAVEHLGKQMVAISQGLDKLSDNYVHVENESRKALEQANIATHNATNIKELLDKTQESSQTQEPTLLRYIRYNK